MRGGAMISPPRGVVRDLVSGFVFGIFSVSSTDYPSDTRQIAMSNFVKLAPIFLTLAFAAVAFAEEPEGQLAVISDPDGFVNMRKSPDAGSGVVLKIRAGEFFLCQPTDEAWWMAEDFFGTRGFVHQSRIKLVKDLSKAEFERLLVNAPRAVTDAFVDIFEVSQREIALAGQRPKSDLPENLYTGWDFVWLYNDDLQQGICLTRGTDGRLPAMVLFADDDVPDVIIDQCGMNEKQRVGSIHGSREKKKRLWDKLIGAATRIPARHFQTQLGLRIGDPLQKAVKLYGEPHHRSEKDGLEILDWGYPGEYALNGFFDLFEVRERALSEDGQGALKSVVLSPEEWQEIRSGLQKDSNPHGHPSWMFDRTRGSSVAEEGGYSVKLYARNGKIIGIFFERPMI